MSQRQPDLSELFGAALESVMAHRQEINDLDGYNGNHGDNMVENMRMVVEALSEKGSRPPAEALGYASQKLQTNGRGGTSQYYARGLGEAAEQLQGQSALESNDVVSIVQSILGAIPSERGQQQPQAGGGVIGQILGMAGGQQPQAGAGGSVLEQILGMAGAQQPQAQPAAGPLDDGLDLGDVLGALVPAGLAFLQAKQTGTDPAAAVGQALIGALMGQGHMNPLQAGTPRAAAGGLVAQSILQALAGRR